MRRCHLLTSFQKSLESDRVRDRVQWYHFYRLFKKVQPEIGISRKNLFFSASKMANSIVVDIVKYLY